MKTIQINIRLTFLSLICLLIHNVDIKANPNYYFNQLSLQDGLTQSTIRCILKDHKGFIWMGTKSGLNRFDRHELNNYFHKENDTTSIPNNLIHFITEDSLYNIWVSTEGGLALYNRNKDNFTPISYKGKPLKVRSFLHTADGMLFGSWGMFYKYRYQTRQIEPVTVESSPDNSKLFGLLEHWKKDTLLVGNRWNGLWLYNTRTNKMTPADFCEEKEIMALLVDSRKRLWISPYGKGIYCFSENGRLLYNYTVENSALNNDIILDIEEKDNQLWLATDGGGINILDPDKKTFSIIEHTPGDIYSLPVNSILCLYKDQENNMWAGSIRGGLFGLKEVSMRTYKDVPVNNSYGLNEKTVLCLYEDNNGMIWAGTDGGGINRLNPTTNTFKHFPSEYGNKTVAITGFNDNELLVSRFGKGLFIFNKQTGQSRPFIFINEEINKKIPKLGISVNLRKIDNNRTYLMADRIYIYNNRLKTFDTLTCREPDLQMGSLQHITTNPYVSYFYGQRHILEANNTQNTIRSIYKTVQSSIINTVCRDKKGIFWIGTTSGLFSFNPVSEEVEAVKTNLFNEVSSLICDDHGNLWVGAQGMLFAYQIKLKKFVHFGESDGAFPNEYLAKPTLLSESGDIYMGGVTGLLRINKNISLAETSYPAVELMDLLLDGAPATGQLDGNKITIPWSNTSLEVKVRAKEKDVFREKIFRYTLSGLGNQNIESYDHTVTLRSLPPGTYGITVSCSTKDGNWSQPIEVLSIMVTPPWWQSKLFIFGVIIALICGIVGVAFAVVKRKENKLKWKMKEHEQETYEEKIRFLINISHELRTPLTLIYAPLKRLLNNAGNKGDEALTQQLTGVYKQAKQMKNIINMVLDVRKMEVGQDTLHRQPYLLNEWVAGIVEDFANEFQVRQIKVNYDFDESVKEVSFDSGKCEIILSNLLMNALKFSMSGTEILIKTEIRNESGCVRVSIKDSGIGLNNIDTQKLFTRFYQGNHDRKGSGIGLSYAKILIEQHSGTIGAENNKDCGATFYYELPLINIASDIACEARPYLNELLSSPKNDNPESSDFQTNDYSILIVEDEPELRQFLKETLLSFFSHVYLAEDGIKALEIIDHHQPDIVVSDVMMPRMDGFELCRRIKENIEISHIPVILLTARNDSESTSVGYKIGADAYLSKPFEVDFLLAVIRNQIRNRENIKRRYKNYSLPVSPQEATFSNADEKFMLKINNLITANIANQELDVRFITDHMGMSRASLYSKLKAVTDMGVNDYINKFRIEKAIYLLTHSDLLIVEVSEQAGFSNQRYFSTAFKQITGKSPSKYKEEKKTDGSVESTITK